MPSGFALIALLGCPRSPAPVTLAAAPPRAFEPVAEPTASAELDEDARLRSALTRRGFMADDAGLFRTRPVDGVDQVERVDVTAATIGLRYDGAMIATVPREANGASTSRLVLAVPADPRQRALEHSGEPVPVGPTPYGFLLAFDDARWMIEPGGRVVAWPELDDPCPPEDEDCEDTLAMVLSAERVALVQQGPAREGALVVCTDALPDCVEQQLESSRALEFLGELVVVQSEPVYAEEFEAWTLVRYAVRDPNGQPLPPQTFAEPPFTLRELGRKPISDPFSRAVLEASYGVVSVTHPRDGASFTMIEPGAPLRRVRPMAAPPLVVCDDRILRNKAYPKLGSRPRVRTFFDAKTYFLEHEYEMPCPTGLVVDVGVRGVMMGERGVGSPAPAPHIISEECPKTPDGFTECTIDWAGDLNRDGVDDAVIRRVGDMGCGEQTMYLSQPEGYVATAAWAWDC